MGRTVRDKIAAGPLAQSGLMDAEAVTRAAEIVARIEADGIETVRLCFVDQHGILRGKTIVAAALASAFTSGVGMPSTLLLKDTSHRTVFPVWNGAAVSDALPLAGASDVLMVPDPETLVPVPWSPHSMMILCDLADRSGRPIAVSSRAILRRAIDDLASAGYAAVMGLEVEFQIFERLDPALDHGQATIPPAPVATRNLTQGWQYLTETRYGEAEGILDTLRRMAEAMGLAPRSMEIEMGPSQFEFTFDASEPVTQADRAVLFRTMVREVCQTRGLHASFMAKPRLPNAAANGWHIHQSLVRAADGQNAFMPSGPGEVTPEAAGWIAGLLDHAGAACLLTAPTVNSYKRFAPFQLAPNRVQWGWDNRGAMIRALLYPGDPASRIENRAADPTANPYLAFTSQIVAGLDGIERGAAPPPATETPYDETAAPLPATMIGAIEAFEGSEMFARRLGAEVVGYLAHIKRAEWDRYLSTISEWEQAEYFNLF
jgi:glutamine synthetase